MTAVRFAVFLLRSPEAGRSHDAAAVTIPPLTFNVRQSCTPRVGLCAVDVAQVAAAAMLLLPGVRHRRCPNCCSRCCALAERDAATAIPVLRNPACSTWVPLSVATGNVRVYFTASHTATVSWSP